MPSSRTGGSVSLLSVGNSPVLGHFWGKKPQLLWMAKWHMYCVHTFTGILLYDSQDLVLPLLTRMHNVQENTQTNNINTCNGTQQFLSFSPFFFHLPLGNREQLLHVSTREIYNYRLKAHDLNPQPPLAPHYCCSGCREGLKRARNHWVSIQGLRNLTFVT